MSGIELGLMIIGASVAMILARVPIAVAMFIGGAGGFAYIVGTAPLLNWMKGVAYGRLASFDLIVVPLFLLMGQFATHGGLSTLLFRFVNAFLGHLRGGLALATVGEGRGCSARQPPRPARRVRGMLWRKNSRFSPLLRHPRKERRRNFSIRACFACGKIPPRCGSCWIF